MQPQIRELLRTLVHTSLLLRVQRIVDQEVTAESAHHTSHPPVQRIYLTDDDLVIQALLLPELELLLRAGDIVDVRRFRLQKSRRTNGTGHIVFLSILDCEIVQRAVSLEQVVREEEEGGFIRDASPPTFATTNTSRKRSSSETTEVLDDLRAPPSKHPHSEATPAAQTNHETRAHEDMMAPSGTQESDDFETVTPDIATTQKRRRALRELDVNSSPHFNKQHVGKFDSSPTRMPQIHVATPSITPLAALPTFVPSTPVTVLVILSWIGQALLRPSQAFPPKRHVKLHDISISKLFSGVSLAVYVDAASFKPDRGTIALLQDIVVQRCGSGNGQVNECFMLNCYANLPAKLEEKGVDSKWYIDDEDELRDMGLGRQIDELKGWWDRREMSRQGSAVQSKQTQ